MSVDKYDLLGGIYKKQSVSSKILRLASRNNIPIYTFNYTDLLEVANYLNKNYNDNIELHEESIVYIHGKTMSSYHGNIVPVILGIDQIDNIKEDFKCMVKPNNIFYKPGIINALNSSSNIIFFGVGFGITDFPYFRDFFKNISEGKKENVRISIFTKGDGTASLNQISQMKGVDMVKLRDNCDLSIYDTIQDGCFKEFEKKIGC